MADLFAAERIVSLTAGVGTDLTIQDAVNNLPAKGGTIYIKHGTYPIAATIVLPDKNIIFRGSGWSTILDMGSNAITLFQAPNGLTKPRMYTFKDMVALGTDGVAQTFFVNLDVNGRGNITVLDSQLGGNKTANGIKTIFDYQAYDTTLNNVSFVHVERCIIAPPSSSGATLIKTPNPAGTHGGYVKFTSAYCDYQVTGGFSSSFVPWLADLDGDMLFIGGQGLSVSDGWASNGLIINAMPFTVGLGITMKALGGLLGIHITDAAIGEFPTGHGNIHFNNPARIKGCTTLVPLFFDAGSDFSAMIGNRFNVGDEFNVTIIGILGCAVIGNSFEGGDGVSLVDAINCRVADNHFMMFGDTNTVAESGASDSNIIHDNTGYLRAGGPIIIGPNTLVHDNLP